MIISNRSRLIGCAIVLAAHAMLVGSPQLRADDKTEEHPIDRTLRVAIDAEPSTMGMVQALSAANEAWDKEMNQVYQRLKQKMQPSEWEAMVNAQRAWINYRDAQITALQRFYGNMEGTMWRPVATESIMQLTRDRARFLLDLESMLEEGD